MKTRVAVLQLEFCDLGFVTSSALPSIFYFCLVTLVCILASIMLVYISFLWGQTPSVNDPSHFYCQILLVRM
jgi:hypothetical protein